MAKKRQLPDALFSSGAIQVRGARVHNLKNIDVAFPRHRLSVVTGLSGSGKSSLVFDVLLAEGQRRYVETFSSYARNFLSSFDRPDVESIEGLSPVVAIEQKTQGRNPRSTVGTVTEIYDFLRLLYARCATPYSYVSGKEMRKYSIPDLVELLFRQYEGEGIEILAPIVKDRKGHYRELLERMRKRGYLSVWADGELLELVEGLQLNRYSNHYVAVVIDKLVVKEEMRDRIAKALTLAEKEGEGMIDVRKRKSNKLHHLSTKLMDAESGLAYPEVSPATFSFNSPRGYCPRCKGLGHIPAIDLDKLIPDPSKSILDGGIVAISNPKRSHFVSGWAPILEESGFSLTTPLREIPSELLDSLIFGDIEEDGGEATDLSLAAALAKIADSDANNKPEQEWANQFFATRPCPICQGLRLNKEALHYRIADYNIAYLSALDSSELYELLPRLQAAVSPHLRPVAEEIIKEIKVRLEFLLNVGLGYLSLGRGAVTLSGGESQRIRLATQIGTGLVEVLYLLDEPGIGLHARDNEQLIASLGKLRDAGNTVIVVEHDRDMMLSADYLVDLGPGAGRLGGHLVYAGPPDEVNKADTLTAQYLSGKKCIEIPAGRRKGSGEFLSLKGATGNNLKGVDLNLPLGTFICVTGVSGSGKSSLISDTLVPAVSQALYRSITEPLPYKKLQGLEHIDKLSVVNQAPLGRTPRSNPATYTGLFTEIRQLFVSLPESKARGYKPGRFSFNVAGGRCEACKGNGYRTLEMRFLPDVTIPCEVCHGKRYNRETLEVRYRGKSIADVLEMTINQAAEFFENIPKLRKRLELMRRVGLGYIKLGQSSTTLSGGESQRVKLAEELSKRDTGKTLYILDEPTTGLHFDDIRMLLSLVNELVDRGNTVLIIEHDLDVIKSADYIVDMGPEGGRDGGEILFAGTPEDLVAHCKRGHTARFLKPLLKS